MSKLVLLHTDNPSRLGIIVDILGFSSIFIHQLMMDTKAEWHGSIQTNGISDTVEHDAAGQLDCTGVLVKPKWRGTSQDKTDMETLGRHQVLRVSIRSTCVGPHSSQNQSIDNRLEQRNFRFFSMLGFGSTLICTWEILLA